MAARVRLRDGVLAGRAENSERTSGRALRKDTRFKPQKEKRVASTRNASWKIFERKGSERADSAAQTLESH